MALPKNLPIRAPQAESEDSGHTTTYQASRGGYYPPNQAQQANEETTYSVERADK